MRLADPRALAPVPPAPTDRRTLTEEVLVVLALSLLASAVYAILDLLSAPLRGTYVAAGNQSNEFLKQVLGFVFGLAPVYQNIRSRSWTPSPKSALIFCRWLSVIHLARLRRACKLTIRPNRPAAISSLARA